MEPKPRSPAPSDALSQGHDIELDQRPRYQELNSPGLEVMTHSTLEVHHVQPAPSPGPPASVKSWEKSGASPYSTPTPAHAAPYSHNGYPHHAQQQQLAPGSMYPPPGAAAGGFNNGRPHTAYSTVATTYGADFQSPFDKSPLMSEHGGATGGGGGTGNGGNRDTICGVRRQLFWIILALVGFLCVVAIATGVGVGVAMKNNGSGSGAGNSTATPTGANFRPAPTAEASTSDVINCPQNNMTLYTPSSTNHRFVLLCGRDYNSDAGTIDLYHEEALTIGECMDKCAAQEECIGAGFGQQTGKPPQCWLKSQLATPNVAPAWVFFVRDEWWSAGNGTA